MPARGRCSLCGKWTRESTLRKTGGLCWNCSHPDFWFMTILIAAAVGAVVLVAVLMYFTRR
ncbi:MAG: hypothetical protein ACUVUC_05300 [Thermoguttaceae bacterium]